MTPTIEGDTIEEVIMDNEIQERAAGASGSRWVMAAVAIALFVISLWALSWAAAEDAECEASGNGFCWAEEMTLWFVASPAWIIAGLFVLGALLPSGTFRRLVMGFGLGLPAGIVILYACAFALAMMGGQPALMLVGAIAALTGFCVAFGIAYRLTN